MVGRSLDLARPSVPGRGAPRGLAAAVCLALGAVLTPSMIAAQYPGLPPPPPCHPQANSDLRTVADRALAGRTLAVVALQNSSSSASDTFLAPALTERLVARLREANTRPVIETRKFGVEQLSTPQAARAVAEAVGASHLLAGTVRRAPQGGAVAISLRVIRAADGRVEWTAARETDLGSMPGVLRELARDALRALGDRRAMDSPDGRWRDPRSAAAYEHYLRGIASAREATSAGWSEAVTQLDSATRVDPTFAPAFSRLAQAYASMLYWGWWDYTPAQRDALARRGLDAAASGLRLDASLSGALAARGALLVFRGPRDEADARAAMRRAVAANPRDAAARHWYGRVLMLLGEDAAARGELNEALRLAPRSPLVLYDLALLLRNGGDVDGACRMLDSAIAVDPLVAPPYALRALVRLPGGQLRYAWADAEIAGRLGWRRWSEAVSAVVDARARDTTSARDRVKQLMASRSASGAGTPDWSGPYVMIALATLGNRAAALDALKRTGASGALREFALRPPELRSLRAGRDAGRRGKEGPPSAGSP